MRTTPLRQAHDTYVDARGWAMATSTMRLRWRLRRLARHDADPHATAQAKALRDELRTRGSVPS